MSEYKIILPSKPRVVLEEENKGVFEIDGLAPGYGHTLGNSLRRIILSSLPGASIVSVKIEGVTHEFQTLDGIKEDVIVMILNLKKIRFKIISGESHIVNISSKGPKKITAADIKTNGQVEILNPDTYIAEITGKVNLNIEMKIQNGLGFVSKETLQKEKVEIGNIVVDAIFTPVLRVSYEVENMRVGDKTNYNLLRISIETDGTMTAREALSESIIIMINQLKAIVDFQEKETVEELLEKKSKNKKSQLNATGLSVSVKKQKESEAETENKVEAEAEDEVKAGDVLKTRIDTLDFSNRTLNALTAANIRSIGGLSRKKREDLLEVEGIGEKGINEIKKTLEKFGFELKD
jgi:DNA-directed RNA polymerase subunit alpha